VGGTVGEELLDLCRDTLPKSGRTPRWGGVGKAGAASRAVRLEPGAHGVLIAVEAPGNLRDAPALGIQQDVVTAFSKVGPGTAGLLSLGLSLRGKDYADHQGSSQEAHMHEETIPEKE
jgi:hypothetical protein